MSYSSLWVMDKSFKGEELEEFSNSWLFSPISWDVLFEKYLPMDAHSGFMGKKNYTSAVMFDGTIFSRLNEKINNSTVQEDRVIWELSNQQIFFTKDKNFVARCIKEFLKTNSKFTSELGSHIYERFDEIANTILNIDETEHPCFIFKNTSVDDNVQYWFRQYNEETDDYEYESLNKIDKVVAEFVIIENDKIVNFIDNISYFK